MDLFAIRVHKFGLVRESSYHRPRWGNEVGGFFYRILKQGGGTDNYAGASGWVDVTGILVGRIVFQKHWIDIMM
jgi:hypothetical protein